MTHGQYDPPAGYPPAPTTPRMPGIAAAAAVLGFVEAGLTVAVASYVIALLGLSPFGLGGDSGGAIAALVVTTVLAALLLLGSLALVRGTGRRLLIGATVAEVVAVLGLVVWAVADASTGSVAADYGTGVNGYDPLSAGASSAASSIAVALATLVLGLSLPVVRLCLAAQRSVGDWLRQRPPAPPVWSAETQQWQAAPRSVPGVAIALLAPVVLVLGLGIVVLTSSTPYPEPTDDLYGAGSPWSGMYDGGTPVEPPGSDSDEYDPAYADTADDCYGGDMRACDDLYVQSPVGSLYEWLGGTCGGREAAIIDTSCE